MQQPTPRATLQEPEPEQPAGRLATEDDVRVWAELVETKRTGGKSARRAANQQMTEFLTRLAGEGGGTTESQLRSQLNQAMHACAEEVLRIPRPAASPAAAPTVDLRRRGWSADGGSSNEPCLYTIQHRRKPTSDERAPQVERSQYLLPRNETLLPRAPIALGELDARFAQGGRRPTLVTLLLVFPEILDEDRLVGAIQAALMDFPAACGRRVGTTITSGPGVRFSVTRVEHEALHARPPPRCLFDPPSQQHNHGSSSSETHNCHGPGTEVLTVRLATSQGERQCSLGICFDHALCDISGAALWLCHVSAHYAEQPSVPLPPRPHHARHEQARIVARCQVQLPDLVEPHAGAAPKNTARGDCQPTHCERIRPVPVRKGGCVCVQWSYTAADLCHLKDFYKAYSRHDACFADVLLLLRSAATGPSTGAGSASSITSVTISRDDRVIAGIPTEHFGNGIVLVKASLPQKADATGCEIAAALRYAILEGQGECEIDTACEGAEAAADVHLNTWWHPLQKPMGFGVCTLKDSEDMIEGQAQQPTFAIGPGSLAGAGQMCLSRGGQPNVTVLPASTSGGFTAFLLCPLEMGHAVLRQLRERRKSSKKEQQKLQPLAVQKQRANTNVVATLPGNPMARVVWFHGLGDASASWHSRFGEDFLARIGGPDSFLQPCAPERTITARQADGPVPAWFDIAALPVTAETLLEHPSGLEEAVARAHNLIDGLIASDTVEPRDIVVGGFSQGGALAILAGLSYPKRLAGIVSLSGWCHQSQTSAALAKQWLLPKNSDKGQGAEQTTEPPPIFFSCGTADPTVDYQLSKRSAAILNQVVGHSGDYQLVLHTQQRAKHPPHQSELTAAANFIIGHTRATDPAINAANTEQVRTNTLAPLPGGWQCSGETNDEMVSKLERAGIITAPVVATAMRATDRALYVPHIEKIKSKTYQYGPYSDAPQSLGFKATISAPHMHAKALDILAEHLLRSKDGGDGTGRCFRVLDVGCGSGVLVALFARMLAAIDTARAGSVAAGPGATEQRRSIVVGIEVVPELVQMSIENLRRDGFHPNAHESGASGDLQLVVRHGNGWSADMAEGSAAAELGPFDAIHVGAAVPGPEIPTGLKRLLKPGGRMILPIGARGTQQVWTMVDRAPATTVSHEEFSMANISGVRFVPLVADT